MVTAGHAPFDFLLHLPKAWCANAARRQRALVPDDVEFATKTEQGTAMVAAAIGPRMLLGLAGALRSRS